jgi:hypothetical protein
MPKAGQTPAFATGERVFVRAGVLDPDHPDIPIGGWSGVIKETLQTRKGISYLIEWDPRTVRAMHPIVRRRCKVEDLDEHEMYLAEEEIDKLTGDPPPIQQPTRIVFRPLSPKKEDDRIRMALGLTSDDPIPKVCEETLRTYHAYLGKHLSFPFEAEYSYETRFM